MESIAINLDAERGVIFFMLINLIRPKNSAVRFATIFDENYAIGLKTGKPRMPAIVN